MQRATWMGLFIVVAQIACANDPSSEPVEPHRTLWDSAGISNYEFSVVHYGATQLAPPMRVVVRDGKVESATLPCFLAAEDCKALEQSWIEKGGTGDLATYARTVPQLFEEVSKARTDASKQDARVLITFDPEYGFPTRFTFDDPKGDDEEFGFQISQFKVIE